MKTSSTLLIALFAILSPDLARADEPPKKPPSVADHLFKDLGLSDLSRLVQTVAATGLSLDGFIRPEQMGVEASDNAIDMFNGNRASASVSFLSNLQIHIHVIVQPAEEKSKGKSPPPEKPKKKKKQRKSRPAQAEPSSLNPA